MLSCADLSLAARDNAQELTCHSGMILQNHRRLPVSIFSVKIAALGSLKRVFQNSNSKFSKLVRISKEQAKTKKQKNFKTIRACTSIIIRLHKNINLVTQSL
jgi:hypothetical protein